MKLNEGFYIDAEIYQEANDWKSDVVSIKKRIYDTIKNHYAVLQIIFVILNKNTTTFVN